MKFQIKKPSKRLAGGKYIGNRKFDSHADGRNSGQPKSAAYTASYVVSNAGKLLKIIKIIISLFLKSQKNVLRTENRLKKLGMKTKKF